MLVAELALHRKKAEFTWGSLSEREVTVTLPLAVLPNLTPAFLCHQRQNRKNAFQGRFLYSPTKTQSPGAETEEP